PRWPCRSHQGHRPHPRRAAGSDRRGRRAPQPEGECRVRGPVCRVHRSALGARRSGLHAPPPRPHRRPRGLGPLPRRRPQPPPLPAHLALGVALGLSLAARPRRLIRLPAWPLYVAPFAAWLLFVTLLKWQPWHVRLHIPFIALMAAPIAARWRRRRAITLAAG